MKFSGKGGSRAFTLAELLVAVAVVGLLAVLLAGNVKNLAVRAQQAKCQSNLRQLGAALLTYAGEHDGRLPPTRHTDGEEQAWVHQLKSYLGDVDAVRICPADPKGAQRLRSGGTSYVLNSIVFVPRTDPFGRPVGEPFNNLLRLDRPARTIFAFIVSDNRGAGASNDHTHSEQWTSWSAFLSDVEPDRFRTGSRSASRTEGSANYLYADGHVAALEAAAMRSIFSGGVNPAEPGRAP